MTEQSSNRCIVLLPAGNSRFTRLFDELFTAAITEAGLVPHRIQQNPEDHPHVDQLIREIAKADMVFADLSQGGNEIWLALGCALALAKPLCLISSTLEFGLPLNLEDLEIIAYPAAPFPRDYSELRRSITHQLVTRRPQRIAPRLQQHEPHESSQQPLPSPPKPSQKPLQPAQEPIQSFLEPLHKPRPTQEPIQSFREPAQRPQPAQEPIQSFREPAQKTQPIQEPIQSFREPAQRPQPTQEPIQSFREPLQKPTPVEEPIRSLRGERLELVQEPLESQTVQPPPAPRVANIPTPIPAVAATPVPQIAPATEVFANAPLPDELTSHEVLALSIINIHASSDGLSPRDLGLEMQAKDSAHLTSHAMSSLKRRKFIDRRPVSVTDGADSYLSDNIFITWSGKNWLLKHGKRNRSWQSTSATNEFFMAAP